MKSTTILNYIAFAILYIALFVFMFNKNTEIIAFWLLLIINSAFVLYLVNEFTSLGTLDNISRLSWLSILISGSLHSVAFIFIAMMIGNMKVKYENTFGTPINLPPEYKEKLELFKQLIISTFCLCFLILVIVNTEISNINTTYISSEKILFFTKAMLVLLSLSSISISSTQVWIANSFSILTRQELMR